MGEYSNIVSYEIAKALNIDTYLLLKYDEAHKDVPNRI